MLHKYFKVYKTKEEIDGIQMGYPQIVADPEFFGSCLENLSPLIKNGELLENVVEIELARSNSGVFIVNPLRHMTQMDIAHRVKREQNEAKALGLIAAAYYGAEASRAQSAPRWSTAMR